MAENQLIFISGGVRSGKSSFAELYAAQIAKHKSCDLYYLATSVSFDEEMSKRIEHHQETRVNSNYNWRTVEAADDVAEAIQTEQHDSVILLDCLTVWLNNEFYKEGITEETVVNDERWNNVKRHIISQIKDINKRVAMLIIVSNDISHDEVKHTPYVNLYSRMLGELHQLIVKEAHRAFLVESTIPILMKQS